MESKKIIEFIQALVMASMKRLELLKIKRALKNSEELEKDILLTSTQISTYITLLDEINKYDNNLFKREEIDTFIESERKPY